MTVSSEREIDVDSDEASELDALEQEETEEHGDFINDDPEDSDYEPSHSSTASTVENIDMVNGVIDQLKEQMEVQIAYSKGLELKMTALLEKLEKLEKKQ